MAISGAQNEKAAKFRRLHNGPRILILPNAWDAASARIFEDAGFPAIATTSGGGAVSLGYPDGEAAPRNEMIDATYRIVRAVQVPLSADIEGGYGRTLNELKALDGPLSVMIWEGMPPPNVLEKLEVRRASTASGPARAAMTTTRRVAEELIKKGSYVAFTR